MSKCGVRYNQSTLDALWGSCNQQEGGVGEAVCALLHTTVKKWDGKDGFRCGQAARE